MIRNVVVGTVRAGVSGEEVEAALQALRDLRVEGVTLRMVSGQDLGLREEVSATYAITVDLDSEDDYRIYDADPEHNRIRREVFAPISESISRIQFALPD